MEYNLATNSSSPKRRNIRTIIQKNVIDICGKYSGLFSGQRQVVLTYTEASIVETSMSLLAVLMQVSQRKRQ